MKLLLDYKKEMKSKKFEFLVKNRKKQWKKILPS
jgi:hypothetical protein